MRGSARTAPALLARIAHLERALAPRSEEGPSPFADWNVVAEVELGAREFWARVVNAEERWRRSPESFVAWERRSVFDKAITASTPEEVEEALGLVRELVAGRGATLSDFHGSRRGQYFAEYHRHKQLQGPVTSTTGRR